ncbi:DUF1120 domain-containing protein [Variovorax sp. RO1]|uniref:DUF1120 domain-containing protein n=1 Tax=Variovorax sp. RO1 TaxID=2066034 RepID=UPI0021508746|nr:DUF1120 domain-containing protein [Variovorax sp. RO1]
MLAPVHASAQGAPLRVTGAFVPAACKPALAGGGVIDYGTIFASSLNQMAQTTLADKSTQLTLTCEAPALFGFKVADERAGTAITSLVTIPNYDAGLKFGLGAADGKNIGAYSLQMTKQTADEGTTRLITSLDGGATWLLNGGAIASDSSVLVAFAGSATGTVPGAHTSMAVDTGPMATAMEHSKTSPGSRRAPAPGRWTRPPT